jgi:hypothetical protein
MSFYGFNWQNNPQYSSLFNPQVMQQAQAAYGQGMSQFTPYDPAQLERLRAAQAARLQQQTKPQGIVSGTYIGPDNKIYQGGLEDIYRQFFKNQNFEKHDIQRRSLMTENNIRNKTDPLTLGFRSLYGEK